MSDGGRVAEGDLDLLGDRAGDHSVLDDGLARHHLGAILSVQCIPKAELKCSTWLVKEAGPRFREPAT